MYTKQKYNTDVLCHRSIRLCGYDYSCNGLYFVTVCCQDRVCLFGKIVDGEMILNAAGRMVEKCWLDITNISSAMPNRMEILRNTSLRILPVGRMIIFILINLNNK